MAKFHCEQIRLYALLFLRAGKYTAEGYDVSVILPTGFRLCFSLERSFRHSRYSVSTFIEKRKYYFFKEWVYFPIDWIMPTDPLDETDALYEELVRVFEHEIEVQKKESEKRQIENAERVTKRVMGDFKIEGIKNV